MAGGRGAYLVTRPYTHLLVTCSYLAFGAFLVALARSSPRKCVNRFFPFQPNVFA